MRRISTKTRLSFLAGFTVGASVALWHYTWFFSAYSEYRTYGIAIVITEAVREQPAHIQIPVFWSDGPAGPIDFDQIPSYAAYHANIDDDRFNDEFAVVLDLLGLEWRRVRFGLIDRIYFFKDRHLGFLVPNFPFFLHLVFREDDAERAFARLIEEDFAAETLERCRTYIRCGQYGAGE